MKVWVNRSLKQQFRSVYVVNGIFLIIFWATYYQCNIVLTIIVADHIHFLMDTFSKIMQQHITKLTLSC